MTQEFQGKAVGTLNVNIAKDDLYQATAKTLNEWAESHVNLKSLDTILAQYGWHIMTTPYIDKPYLVRFFDDKEPQFRKNFSSWVEAFAYVIEQISQGNFYKE